MFILGVRDREGVKLALRLGIIWVISLFVILFSNVTISLLCVVLSVCATVHGARLLLAMRETLVFGNDFTRDTAFPSSRHAKRAVFAFDAAIALLVFAPSAMMLVLKPEVLTEPEEWLSSSVFFLMGFCGVLGLAWQALGKFGKS